MIVEYLVIGLMLVVPFLLLLFPEASTPRLSWPRARQRPGQYRGMPVRDARTLGWGGRRGLGRVLGVVLHSKAHDDACRAFPSSPLPRGLDPALIMASCTSAPWAISRHALHGTVGAYSAVHACVMRALWGGGEGGDWGVLGVVLHSKAHDDACRAFPSSPLPRGLDPALIMASWVITPEGREGRSRGPTTPSMWVLLLPPSLAPWWNSSR